MYSPPRLDGDLPQMALAQRIERLDHMILGALARATRNDDRIVGAGSVGESGFHLLFLVGQDAEIHRVDACRAGQTLQHR